MTEAQTSIECAIGDTENLRRHLKELISKQVQSEDEKQIIKATAHAWFNNHRSTITNFVSDDATAALDDEYRTLLGGQLATSCVASTWTGLKILRTQLQADHVLAFSKTPAAVAPPAIADNPPAFTSLISDPKMQRILQNRWQKCVLCVKAGAPLGATVMMGGILEGLLLARINQLPNQAPVHTAKFAPRDRMGRTLPLKDWTLKDYIDVAQELTWIAPTAKDIGAVLRDYRNYIHPQKELSNGISLTPSDAAMLWNIAKHMIVQVLKT